MLWRTKFCVVGGSLALLIFGAGTAGAHSVYEAEQTLYQRGYSDIRVERASLPLQLQRLQAAAFAIISHVDYNGDLVQVDAMGPCYGNGDGSEYEDRGGYNGRYR